MRQSPQSKHCSGMGCGRPRPASTCCSCISGWSQKSSTPTRPAWTLLGTRRDRFCGRAGQLWLSLACGSSGRQASQPRKNTTRPPCRWTKRPHRHGEGCTCTPLLCLAPPAATGSARCCLLPTPGAPPARGPTRPALVCCRSRGAALQGCLKAGRVAGRAARLLVNQSASSSHEEPRQACRCLLVPSTYLGRRLAG